MDGLDRKRTKRSTIGRVVTNEDCVLPMISFNEIISPVLRKISQKFPGVGATMLEVLEQTRETVDTFSTAAANVPTVHFEEDYQSSIPSKVNLKLSTKKAEEKGEDA